MVQPTIEGARAETLLEAAAGAEAGGGEPFRSSAGQSHDEAHLA